MTVVMRELPGMSGLRYTRGTETRQAFRLRWEVICGPQSSGDINFVSSLITLNAALFSPLGQVTPSISSPRVLQHV
jgi:hypothetical protein